jgi:hypothetical protein
MRVPAAAQYEKISAAEALTLRDYESNPATEPRFLRHFNSFLHKHRTVPRQSSLGKGTTILNINYCSKLEIQD